MELGGNELQFFRGRAGSIEVAGRDLDLDLRLRGAFAAASCRCSSPLNVKGRDDSHTLSCRLAHRLRVGAVAGRMGQLVDTGLERDSHLLDPLDVGGDVPVSFVRGGDNGLQLIAGEHRPVAGTWLERYLDDARPPVDKAADDTCGLGGAADIDVDRATPGIAWIAARHADDRAGAEATLLAGPLTRRAERADRLAQVAHRRHARAHLPRHVRVHVQVDETREDRGVFECNPAGGLRAESRERANPDHAPPLFRTAPSSINVLLHR